MKQNYLWLLCSIVLAFSSSKLSFADENISKNISENQNKIISGNFETEFFDTYNYDSNDKINEFNESYIRSTLNLKVKLPQNLSLNTQLRLREDKADSIIQQVGSKPNNGSNRYFKDETLYLKKLHLDYDYNKGKISAGKFTTQFGTAWARRDSIWLFEEARTNYEADEKLGFGNYFKAGDEKKNGQYILGLEVFTNDNKYLDISTINKREMPIKSDDVPGSDRGLKSYDLSMKINYDFGNEEKLSYNLSYINLAVNDKNSPTKDDMGGYSLSLDYQYPFHQNILGNAFVEYVNFNNYQGNTDRDIDFLTTILSLEFYKNYKVTLGRIHSKETYVGTDGIDRDTKELNFGYRFSDQSILKNFNLIAGIKNENIDYKVSKVKTNAVGTRIAYILPF